ncbi:phosphatase PAP2 family protein [Halomonas sp. 328]|uniref:phosphatase PAP2 family protein n=1 Tax=Halomonas sp. 328 TaxID=2776704 RepID=UPI0018A6E7A7|nr:phosphatase PAP2 family protein [Halomonas sp. 328]MBF8222075.1 phosphatase PAP2 family protein [Halomonas sp. 328]
MTTPRPPALFQRLDLMEWSLCHRLAVATDAAPLPLGLLRLASRLGDWPAWAVLIALQPLLHGAQGWRLMLHFGLTALVAVTLYRLIKTRLCRERPSISFQAIPCREPPRDRYSFPSGHTLHAVLFSLLSAATQPWLLVVVLPLALLIAASRVGLGLHYISDVIGGALLGLGIGLISLPWLL